MEEPSAIRALKGRGAVSNRTGRFEPLTRHLADDGWETAAEVSGEKPRTTITDEHPKKIIARNTSPDVPFDRSINPYRGCEHGCVYCFARPSHAYHGLSPGLDFETQLFAKPGAAELLARELGHPKYRCRALQLGANTDPYQPIEKRLRITRRVLEVLSAHNHPVAIVTKSDMVLCDLDILGAMAEKGLAAVGISVTTLDGDLARRMEPRAPTPAKRLAAISGLSEAGVPVSVLFAPLIPGLNDHEMEAVLEAAAGNGAAAAHYLLLRLPHEIKELFSEWLDEHAPNKKSRALSLLRDTRGGTLYRAQWGERMTGRGVYADLIAERFRKACARLGFDQRAAADHRLETKLFRVPPRAGDQLTLF